MRLAEYGFGLSPDEPNPEKAVEELVSFLPVLAYDRRELTAGGYEDWSVEVIGSGFTESPCAAVGLGFDGERKVVFLVPEPDK